MIAIVDFGSKKVPQIEEMVNHCGYTFFTIPFEGVTPERFADAKCVILSGSPTMLSGDTRYHYISRMEFLKDLNSPILGICFGHQLLSLIFGGDVYTHKLLCSELPINVVMPDPVFDGMGERPVFAENHTEGATLPKDFVLLASSVDYPVEAMRHKTKKIYGVQFHPEMSGANGRKFFNNFFAATISYKAQHMEK